MKYLIGRLTENQYLPVELETFYRFIDNGMVEKQQILMYKKLFSLNSCAKGNHRSKTTKIKGVI
jgi:hypothetical protein